MTNFDKFSQILNLVIIVLSIFFVIGLTYSGAWLSMITWVCIGINATMNYHTLPKFNKSIEGE